MNDILMPAITGICLLIGKAIKASPINSRIIPAVCLALGMALGVAGFYLVPDFPADNLLTAIWVGLASGGAATGLHQAERQFAEEG